MPLAARAWFMCFISTVCMSWSFSGFMRMLSSAREFFLQFGEMTWSVLVCRGVEFEGGLGWIFDF